MFTYSAETKDAELKAVTSLTASLEASRTNHILECKWLCLPGYTENNVGCVEGPGLLSPSAGAALSWFLSIQECAEHFRGDQGNLHLYMMCKFKSGIQAFQLSKS